MQKYFKPVNCGLYNVRIVCGEISVFGFFKKLWDIQPRQAVPALGQEGGKGRGGEVYYRTD